MASAKSLRPNMTVIVNSGPHQGCRATVVDPTVQPDGSPNQRKILVNITTGIDSWDEWIIPKQLSLPNAPVQTATPAPVQTAAVAPAPVAAPVPSVDIEEITLDHPMFDRFRPSRPNLLKQYVSRTLPGEKTDIDALITYYERRDSRGYATNVGLVGDTQSGKTMLVEVLATVIAQRMGLSKPLPVFTLSGSSGITDHDLFGQYRPDEFGSLRWMEGIVALAARFGGILYLDEVNAMPGNVTSALHPLTDDRRQFVNIRKPVPTEFGGWTPEVVNASKDLWVLCTYNPGYAGMSRTNEAFANRFSWFEWGYDDNVEKKLIKSPAIRQLGQALRLARETRAISTPVGTSALQRLEQDVKDLGLDFALWAFMGQFTSPTEKSKVDHIITDRSIKSLLIAELEGVMTIEEQS